MNEDFLSRGHLSVLTNFDRVFAANSTFSSTQCREKYRHHRGTREFTCVLGWLYDLIMRIGRLTFNLHLVTPWHFIPVALRHSRIHCVKLHSLWIHDLSLSQSQILYSFNAKTHLISWNVSSYVKFFNKFECFS